MSKLFDQLKNASRSREEKSPGLLLEALQRSQQRDPNTAAEAVPAAVPADSASAAPPAQSPAPAGAQSPKPTPFAGVALAASILAIVWLVWSAAPWHAPEKVRIDPSTLKLDRSFQLDRPSPKGTTAPSRPS